MIIMLFILARKKGITRSFQQVGLYPVGSGLLLETDKSEISGVFHGFDGRGALILELQGEKQTFFAARICTIRAVEGDENASSH